MLENEYIELTNQLKTKFDEVEKKEKKLAIKIQDLTKQLCSIYGLIRILDNYIDERPIILDFIINTLRSLMSEVLFKDLEEEII